LIKSSEDKEDSKNSKEIKKIKNSKDTVLIKNSFKRLGNRTVIKSSLFKFNKSSPKELSNKIVIKSSLPKFNGLGIDIQSKESNIQLFSQIKTSGQTVINSQTINDLNKQGVR
jgi:hypothetical protein